jgi:hypothetical protein
MIVFIDCADCWIECSMNIPVKIYHRNIRKPYRTLLAVNGRGDVNERKQIRYLPPSLAYKNFMIFSHIVFLGFV